MIKKLYHLLEIPFVYRLSQVLLAPGLHLLMGPAYRKVFNHPAGKVLDVGCGPMLNTPQPGGLLVGIDINETYIRQYTGGYVDQDPRLIEAPPSDRKRLGFVASAEKLPFPDGAFDEARSFGLFHHLTKEEATWSIREMDRCVRPGGRLIILDAVLPVRPWAWPLAWVTRKLDRGLYMRKQEEILELVQGACAGPWDWERRIGTFTGMEYLVFQRNKG